MKYFKNVKSYDDLKKQYRDLLKANHPDNGGDPEAMKEINIQYDALFAIWKNRQEEKIGEKVEETAESTRRAFYTAFGWEGSRYDGNLTLKEIAKIVRAYIKEKYPLYKFSVRTSYASMCQELHVDLLESPIEIYKPFDDLDLDDFQRIGKMIYPVYDTDNYLAFLNSSKEEKKAIIDGYEYQNQAHVLNDVTRAVIDDVDAFVRSYNYHDCDGQIDYFDVNFYYFGCCRNNGASVAIVPKTPRIKNRKADPAVRKSSKDTEPDAAAEPAKIAEKSGYTYKITRGQDTRDGSDLWIVRIAEELDRAGYIAENKAMKARGAYYSKFLHGFLFRFDPADLLGMA